LTLKGLKNRSVISLKFKGQYLIEERYLMGLLMTPRALRLIYTKILSRPIYDLYFDLTPNKKRKRKLLLSSNYSIG